MVHTWVSWAVCVGVVRVGAAIVNLLLLTATGVRTRRGTRACRLTSTPHCDRRAKCKCSLITAPRGNDGTPFFFSIHIPSNGCRMAIHLKDGGRTKIAAMENRSHQLFVSGLTAGGKRFMSRAFVVGGHGPHVSRGRSMQVGPHRGTGLG